MKTIKPLLISLLFATALSQGPGDETTTNPPNEETEESKPESTEAVGNEEELEKVTDYGVCGENNTDPDTGEQLDCYCKIQSDTEVSYAEPWTIPFFGTNFCHKLSIDSPTCCN